MTVKKGDKTSTSGVTPDQQAIIDAFKQQLASGATTGTGRVYMGGTPVRPGTNNSVSSLLPHVAGSSPAALPSGSSVPRPHVAGSSPAPLIAQKWMSEDEAADQYFNWTQKQRDDFRAKGLLSGLLTQGAGDLEAYNLWANLVKQASLYGAQDKQVSPLDILSGYVKANSSGGWIKSGDFEVNPVTGEKRYVGPRFKTTTQTATDLTDPATARAIATAVFQDLLGRDPGQGEIASYAEALAASERSNPSTVTTTTEYDPKTGEPIGSSSTTQGGVTDQGRQLIAEDKIKQGSEYGAVQAATTYMNALQQAVGG